MTPSRFVVGDHGRGSRRGARGRRAARRGRDRPRRRSTPGQGAAARQPRRDPPDRGASRDHADRQRGAPASARSPPTRRSPRRDGARALHRARRRGGDRRLACDAGAGDDRRQPDERLAGDGDRRAAHRASMPPSRCARRGRPRELAVEDLFSGPGATIAEPGELLAAVDVPAPADGTGSCYVRLEYRRQMEIAVVGATAARDARRTAASPSADRDHGARADDPPRRRGRGGARGSDGGADAVAAAAAAAAPRQRADLRRPRLGRLPRARWPR